MPLVNGGDLSRQAHIRTHNVVNQPVHQELEQPPGVLVGRREHLLMHQGEIPQESLMLLFMLAGMPAVDLSLVHQLLFFLKVVLGILHQLGKNLFEISRVQIVPRDANAKLVGDRDQTFMLLVARFRSFYPTGRYPCKSPSLSKVAGWKTRLCSFADDQCDSI